MSNLDRFIGTLSYASQHLGIASRYWGAGNEEHHEQVLGPRPASTSVAPGPGERASIRSDIIRLVAQLVADELPLRLGAGAHQRANVSHFLLHPARRFLER